MSIIHYPNKLIEARYKLSLQQKRLIMLLISKATNDGDFLKEYQISTKEFADYFNISGQSITSELKNIAISLLSQTLIVDGSEEGSDFIYLNWISSVRFDKDKNQINFVLNPKIKTYLSNHHTSILDSFLKSEKLNNDKKQDFISKLKSFYSVKLYLLLNDNKKSIKFSINDLREFLGINSNLYETYAQLKARVLSKIVLEINNKTDISIWFDEIKNGKKVENIIFHYSEKNARSHHHTNPVC